MVFGPITFFVYDCRYRQGMNELLATVLYLLHIEAWREEGEDLRERLPAGGSGAAGDGGSDGEGVGGNESRRKEEAADRVAGASAPSPRRTRSISTPARPSAAASDPHVLAAPCASIASDAPIIPAAAASPTTKAPRRTAPKTADELVLAELTDPRYLEHDAFALFGALMERLSGLFAPARPRGRRRPAARAKKEKATGREKGAVRRIKGKGKSHHVAGAAKVDDSIEDAASSREADSDSNSNSFSSLSSSSSSSDGEGGGSSDVEDKVDALQSRLTRIHSTLLQKLDPPLATHLAALGVEPQMYLLRWVRLMLSREFELQQVGSRRSVSCCARYCSHARLPSRLPCCIGAVLFFLSACYSVRASGVARVGRDLRDVTRRLRAGGVHLRCDGPLAPGESAG